MGAGRHDEVGLMDSVDGRGVVGAQRSEMIMVEVLRFDREERRLYRTEMRSRRFWTILWRHLYRS